ncbi:MgtC/SapB family protein [Cohnella thailandensis]|uniref:MgtC/SapB family protein n=1 Tax=Cohnella thailandensis TaxID=557557 RepID=A0A841SXS5_9BACL|nr:MgtC/SapB family protein [Cohnella thailandensis]MBB6635426.1 MgtC/SapB family protein [Cohnella thailandensis]MBP1974806.1 putative Mg2+ transporter-C (MgtC) family protein [Cohnella thailandensis]
MFAASGSVWEISQAELAVRMVLAAALGGAIGIEREWNNHAAGFRTHILVCLGAATIMLMSIYGFSQFVNEPNVQVDPARLAAQVISGIGFLGAGAILRNGSGIKGLTTAASIWTVAAIGLCVGAGFLTAAFLCTFLVLVSLYVLNKWEKQLLRHRRTHKLEVTFSNDPEIVGRIAEVFIRRQMDISQLRIHPDESEEGAMKLEFKVKRIRFEKLLEAVGEVGRLEGIKAVETDGLDSPLAA